jgi:hypothetical protein
VVALPSNPVFADRPIRQALSPNAYHGTVIWSWQQAVLAAGLRRQLERTDLPERLRQRLNEGEVRVWEAIRAAGDMQTSELWSWNYKSGCYRITPFGEAGAHAEESDAAQLWSTVFLTLRPPPRGSTPHRRNWLAACA